MSSSTTVFWSSHYSIASALASFLPVFLSRIMLSPFKPIAVKTKELNQTSRHEQIQLTVVCCSYFPQHSVLFLFAIPSILCFLRTFGENDMNALRSLGYVLRVGKSWSSTLNSSSHRAVHLLHYRNTNCVRRSFTVFCTMISCTYRSLPSLL